MNDTPHNLKSAERDVTCHSHQMSVAKVVFLGECQVGKSCLVNSLLGNSSPFPASTVGAVKQSVSVEIDGRTQIIDMWDTAGQEKYRTLMPLYFRGADVAVMVFDQTLRKSFDQLSEWNSLLTECAPHNITRIIVGNKDDLPDQGITDDEIGLAVQNLGAKAFLHTSAKSGLGIRHLFEEIRSVKFGVPMNSGHVAIESVPSQSCC
jgi:small GTP-binding protein